MGRIFKKFHGISASIDPGETGLYRALLPDLFDMPRKPVVAMTITEYVHVAAWPLLMSYREGAIALKSRYGDDEGWFVLDMPVTKGIAAMTGRGIGLPKRRVESIRLKPELGIWQGDVTADGRGILSVELSPDGDYPRFEPDRPDCPIPAPPLETAHIVRSSRGGTRPRRIELQVKQVIKETPKLPGTARVTVDPNADWAPLVDDSQSWPGVYFQFWGGASIVFSSLE